jgi:hypothetical protein
VGYLSQSVTHNLEETNLDSYLESEEMSDVEDGSRSSSGRASPMTPPQTPPPQGESPVREGGLWGRKVREKLRLRRG